jgi:hypothetical protein
METEPPIADQPKRKRRFQFRLRTLLIVVTVVAFACWGAVLYRRASEFRDRDHRDFDAYQAAPFAGGPEDMLLLSTEGELSHNMTL